ncbi:MAG: 6,7-dimethyl-8-ribityllumazine synthase [Sphingobacteriaceae bacterium]|nr:6,7-dimethyl-8-ribityllumazine synthase [Sphingobacteriaceae bacterium]
MSSKLKNLSDFSNTTIPNGKKYKVAIVVSEWNAKITDKLYQGAFNSLVANGVKEKNIFNYTVPGSYELTTAAEMLLTKKTELDAVICLGCVIQGETKHFDFICNAVANGLTQISTNHKKPVVFGVLTPNTEQQAIDRAGGKHGNKGDEAAITALKMIYLNSII